MTSRARAWFGYFGLWTLLGLVFASQLFLVEQRSSPHPSTWWQALRSELPDWYLWGLLALVVGALARRFRIDRSNWERAVPIHLGASLTLGFLHLVLATAIQVMLRGSEPYPFLPKLVDNFAASYHWNLLIYWAIVALAHARDYAQDAREHRMRAAEARLQALTLQLRPHFLFNTLNAISVLTAEDAPKAKRMLLRLADLLRITLAEGNRQEVHLSEELDLLERYLDIQRARFEERLSILVDVEPAIRDALVPVLLLQPLVENAIRHGLDTNLGVGTVSITARRENDRIRLEVRDNGRGLRPSSAGRRDGVGLANTRARLAHLYGERQTLDLVRPAEGGTAVLISLPLRIPA